MRLRLISCAGLLAFCASLQGATSYNFDFNSTSSSLSDGSYPVNPYTGTVGGTAVTLYCDDFQDNINWGQQNISAYVTALTATGATLQDDTRYGDHNAPGNTYTAGTTLYEELAWLATQSQNTTGANASYNDIAIQEAMWTLTNDSSDPSPHNQTTTGTGTKSDSGVQQSYLAWISDAESDYNTTVSGYASLVTNDWYIVTAVSSAGCTVGSDGSTGCTPGTAGTGNVTQEFLAYSSSPVSTTTQAATPEPASFILIGSGLLLGAIVGRRRMEKAKAKA